MSTGFTTVTGSMFTPDELFDALDIPFAGSIGAGTKVDLTQNIIFIRATFDSVQVIGACPHCGAHAVEVTVPGRELPEVLVRELNFDPQMATTITNATYWLPTGSMFSVPYELVLAAD